MSLKASERAQLLRGEFPSLSRPFIEGEPAPFVKGQVIVLKRISGVPQAWLTILVVKREKKGGWAIEYSFRNDQALFLRRTGGLTSIAADSCDPEADVIDPATKKAWATKARLETIERKRAAHERDGRVSELSQHERRRQERAIREALKQTLDGLDPSAASELLARIESQIEEFQSTKEAA